MAMRDVWRRPSIVLGAWIVLFVAVFVLSGDLRVDANKRHAAVAAPDARAVPVVVRSDPPARVRSEVVVRHGRVFDALGFLLVGAEVVPMHRPPERTDAEGAFRVELEADAWTDVLVRAAGQRSAWLRVAAASPDAFVARLVPSAPWDQEVGPPTDAPRLRGEGFVRTPDGQALVNAFVTALGTGIWARTDAAGRFTVPLPGPAATLFVHQPDAAGGGLALLSAPLGVDRAHGLMPLPELVASAAAVVRGTLRDPVGNPLGGVPIHVGGERLQRVIETGQGGVFRIGGLPPGRYELQAYAFRGAIGVATAIDVQGPVVDCELRMEMAQEKRLRVIDESGAPVASVYVVSTLHGRRRGVAHADADGWAAVPVTGDAEFDVHLPVSYAPVPVRRFASEASTLTVAMP